ncbi:ribbon-helix-helix protein, CopG family [Blastococcus sp. Marseille-P5729]|uniref:ribbon-helix-helix protein, CopG family n=1 Tax=Blastococcus sp. Marseille-P5729 TaxID=2086582 RepID=UPI000D0F12E9|nr:ribbon-helix-helix protein, CopG family [Blastococcus sp. Marseille-P5729]
MRTTVNLPPDLEAEVARLRREEGMGTSEAIVALARRGLTRVSEPRPFTQRTARLNAKVDLTNIGEVLDLLENT